MLHTLFEVHPSHRPATCYVADLQMEDDIKLEWLAQELGDEASLPDFAKKFKELFGEKLKGKTQKSRCLEFTADMPRSKRARISSRVHMPPRWKNTTG